MAGTSDVASTGVASVSAAAVNAAFNGNAALNAGPGNAGPEDASMGVAPPLSAALPAIQEGSISQGVNSAASANAALIPVVGGPPRKVRNTCAGQSIIVFFPVVAVIEVLASGDVTPEESPPEPESGIQLPPGKDRPETSRIEFIAWGIDNKPRGS